MYGTDRNPKPRGIVVGVAVRDADEKGDPVVGEKTP
jgi:hypothetical protein